MNAINTAFNNVSAIMLIYISILICYWLLASGSKRRYCLVTGIVNYSGLLGLSSILVMAAVSPFKIDYGIVGVGIFIELFCAAVFLYTCFKIINFIKYKAKPISNSQITLLILLKLLFLVVNYEASDGQYGIFSDSSRIDNLNISPFLAKTWLIELLIDFIVLTSLFLKTFFFGRFRFYDACIILLLIVCNFTTGSKGGVFILIVSIILLIYAAFPKIIPKSLLVKISIFLALLAFVYIYIFSELHNVTVSQQINLIIYRFLLSADARIMTFEPGVNDYVLSQSHGAMISELFRGPARILGLSTADFPLGIYQYQYAFGVTNFQGSTSQLSAIFMTYQDEFWLLDFGLIAVLVFFQYQFFTYLIRSNTPGVAWISAASLFYLSGSLSQGFDAYVQLLPIALLIIIFFFIANSIIRNLKT